ncbi:hypothetical protein LCGC14_0353300 [marine sediment metagenome]|uniref:Uncharacterized protein n=1 Tax=marine sediment metagenome TaxID=412755 RepID=A0A0F9WI55_9ZZZZ
MTMLPRFGQNIVQQPPPNPGSDIPICFGDGDEFCWVWDTSDPDANLLMGGLPVGGAVNVPVVAIGIGIVGQNLGLFDGIVDAQYAVVDRDFDSAVMLGFIDDDAPAIQFAGSSNGLMVAFGAGAPPADNGLHLWFGTAGVVAARADSGLILEHLFQGLGRTVTILGPNTETQQGFIFADEDSNIAAGIFYSHADDRMAFRIGGVFRALWTAGALAFQEATMISTTAGDLTLSPAGSVDIDSNNLTTVSAIVGMAGGSLLLLANASATDPVAQRVIIRSLDTVGNTRLTVAYAEPTATETTPFWAQRADITLPVAAALDANFLTFRWTPADDVVTVFVNDGGVIRSIAIGTVV